MSDDISDQVTTAVKASKHGFAMQLGESTDVTICSQWLVYVRFTENDVVTTEPLWYRLQQRSKIIFHHGLIIRDKLFRMVKVVWLHKQ